MHQNLYRIMANHKNSNELETEREPGNGDKRVIYNFQKETQLAAQYQRF